MSYRGSSSFYEKSNREGVKRMSNNGIVNIKGKDYITVGKRVEMAQEGNTSLSITTELVSTDPILFKATVVTKKGTFTGYSASYGDPKKFIETQSPYEVAETSAVGRALGFAGYGIIEGIASADEMVKTKQAEGPEEYTREKVSETPEGVTGELGTLGCEICGAQAEERRGHSKTTGKAYHAIFCSSGDKSHIKWFKDA